MKNAFIFIFLISSTIPAQDFNIGFGLQASLYKKYDLIKSEGITNIAPFPPEFHFSFEYLPIEILAFQLRFGSMVESNKNGISGFEYGALVKYFVNPSIYAIGIYTTHLNISFSGGGHSTRKTVTFGMPGLGIGYKATNILYLELTYLDPQNVIIIEDYNYFLTDPGPYNKVQLNWLIRMNVEFYFSL